MRGYIKSCDDVFVFAKVLVIVLASQISTKGAASDAPMLHPTNSVRFSEKDIGAEAFLGTIMPCKNEPATMLDFLDMISSTYRSLGLHNAYTVVSRKSGTMTYVYITDYTTDLNDHQIREVPMMTMFKYRYHWPFPDFIGAVPTNSSQIDPLGYFEANGDEVCSEMHRYHRAVQSF